MIKQDDLRAGAGTRRATSALPIMPMEKPKIAEVLIFLTNGSKQFRLCAVEIFGRKKLIHPMPLKACRQVDRAEVVGRAIFTTRNSLKSHIRQKSNPLFSNIRAVTRKLCGHTSATGVENHLLSEFGAPLKSP